MRLLFPALLALSAPALTMAQAHENFDPSEPLISEPVPRAAERGTLPVLFDNGPLVTNPGAGPAGSDLSVLQTNLGMTTFGLGNQLTAGNRIADDFTVPAGQTWLVQGFAVYHY